MTSRLTFDHSCYPGIRKRRDWKALDFCQQTLHLNSPSDFNFSPSICPPPAFLLASTFLPPLPNDFEYKHHTQSSITSDMSSSNDLRDDKYFARFDSHKLTAQENEETGSVGSIQLPVIHYTQQPAHSHPAAALSLGSQAEGSASLSIGDEHLDGTADRKVMVSMLAYALY